MFAAETPTRPATAADATPLDGCYLAPPALPRDLTLCSSCDCLCDQGDTLCPSCLAEAIDDDRAEGIRDFWDSIGLDGEGR